MYVVMLIVLGRPDTIFGPFDSEHIAADWAADNCPDATYRVMRLFRPK